MAQLAPSTDSETLECDCSANALYEFHPAISQGIALACHEALRASFGPHHTAPASVTVQRDGTISRVQVRWLAPDARICEAWADRDVAVEWGATCLALATAKAVYGLVAVHKLRKFSGADYFLAPHGDVPPNLKACTRLEISGVDHRGHKELRNRLRQKVMQLGRYLAQYPGLALVVGFRARTILVKSVAGK